MQRDRYQLVDAVIGSSSLMEGFAVTTDGPTTQTDNKGMQNFFLNQCFELIFYHVSCKSTHCNDECNLLNCFTSFESCEMMQVVAEWWGVSSEVHPSDKSKHFQIPDCTGTLTLTFIFLLSHIIVFLKALLYILLVYNFEHKKIV